VSWDHPGRATPGANRNPTLLSFNVYGVDLETIQFCCASGHCEDCRDSQAVQTWFLVSVRYFLQSNRGFRPGSSSRRRRKREEGEAGPGISTRELPRRSGSRGDSVFKSDPPQDSERPVLFRPGFVLDTPRLGA